MTCLMIDALLAVCEVRMLRDKRNLSIFYP